MRYFCLACDYDGTLAHDGRVSSATCDALGRVRESGRKVFLVTGREIADLQTTFDRFDLFDLIVAENGAVLYRPADQSITPLCPPPPPEFSAALKERGVKEISVGHVIVATWQPYEATVLKTIRDLGLELQVIFNKGAVMVLPAGVTKATGLTQAAEQLGLSLHNVVAVGDAENDHSFLQVSEFAVAVANAIPMLQERADWVTPRDHGEGVQDLIAELLADDLAARSEKLSRHAVVLGRQGEADLHLDPHGAGVLIAGSSGAGKSTLAVGLLERLGEAGYQFCVVDPEGDYSTLEGAVAFGNAQQPPHLEEVMQVLRQPKQNVVVNLAGLRLAERPDFFVTLLTRLQDLRSRCGRPHWILVDEAHHVMPNQRAAQTPALPEHMSQMVYITLEPSSVDRRAFATVGTVVGVGEAGADAVQEFARVCDRPAPDVPRDPPRPGQVLVWRMNDGHEPEVMEVVPGRSERRRHRRKYAEGDLGPERSFYFRGPEDKLKLQAQNLIIFLQVAQGVDDETWQFHLQQGDYSHWFREGIKDDALAEEAAQIEAEPNLSPAESRERIRALVERDYTLPAGA